MNMDVRFLLAGLVSGTLSAVLMQVEGDVLLYWVPGLVFGVFFVLATGMGEGFSRWMRFAGLALLSVIAWRVAVFIAQQLITGSTVPFATVHEHRFWYAGIAAGFVGGALLGGATWLMRLGGGSRGRFAALVVAGAALGVLLHFWPQRIGESDFHLGPYVLLIPWQGVVAVMLGRVCDGGQGMGRG